MQRMDQGMMDHGDMKGMDHEQMDHGQMDHGAVQPAASATTQPSSAPARTQPSGHNAMDMDRMMKSMQGGSLPPDARDPDAYSGGLKIGPLPGMDMADDDIHSLVLLDQLEGDRARGGESGVRLDAQAWFGTDLDKLWLKVEGSRSGGTLGPTRTEALYNRAFAPYFGWQVGLRHDFGGEGPSRNWAAFGIQGLAPYWFHVEATAYVGEAGRTALRLEAEYDLLITQRLILQPDVEARLFGRNDPERHIGSGLSEIEAGLRLRYEITRKFAPYVGVSWGRRFGNTADFARRAGEDVRETRFVAGIRIWF